MEIINHLLIGKINAIQNIEISKMELDDTSTVQNYILKETSCFNKRLLDSLKLVSLKENCLEKKMNQLSTTEKIKVELAIALILNKECIVFPYFSQYFMEKDKLFFKKIFKKLATKYKKTICFLNSDLSFLMDFVDRIVLIKKKETLFLDSPTFYEKELLNEYSPKIVEFIDYLNHCGHKFLNYTDSKELLKAIFREV